MPKTYKPISPGRRFLISSNKDELTCKEKRPHRKIPFRKSLFQKKKSTGGRNNLGRITCRHRGGGHKRFYRLIDFKRDKVGIPARVVAIEYDPNRSAHIARICYQDGEYRYILAPKNLKKGDVVLSGEGSPFNVGCAMALKNMLIGAIIHNIELSPGRGGLLVRAAGQSAQLVGKSGGYATVRLPSKETRLIHEDCFATLGELSHSEHSLSIKGKAGRNRWNGRRPTVRGVAMNPVDHPHGGGEGRRQHTLSLNPWATRKKGEKTRQRKKNSSMIVQSRKSRRRR